VRWDERGEEVFLASEGRLVRVRVDGSLGKLSSAPEVVEAGLEPVGWDLLNFDRLPDGRTAYERYELRTKLRRLTRNARGGWDARWLETGTGRQDYPALSPSGEELALLKQDSRGLNVYVQPVSGGDPYPVTRTVTRKRHPRWSPDGNQIAFVQTNREGDGLVVVGRDGERPHEVASITSPSVASPFAWAPEGTSLVYVDRGEVWEASEGGAPRKLLAVPEDITVAWSLGVSPAGDSVALLAHTYSGGDVSPVRVYVASLADPEAGWSLRFERDWGDLFTEGVQAVGSVFVDWSRFALLPWQIPGTLDVVVPRQTKGRDIVEIWRISLETGNATLGVDLSEHCSGGVSEVTATPDLSEIVCTVRDATRDIWLLGPSERGSSR